MSRLGYANIDDAVQIAREMLRRRPGRDDVSRVASALVAILHQMKNELQIGTIYSEAVRSILKEADVLMDEGPSEGRP